MAGSDRTNAPVGLLRGKNLRYPICRSLGGLQRFQPREGLVTVIQNVSKSKNILTRFIFRQLDRVRTVLDSWELKTLFRETRKQFFVLETFNKFSELEST